MYWIILSFLLIYLYTKQIFKSLLITDALITIVCLYYIIYIINNADKSIGILALVPTTVMIISNILMLCISVIYLCVKHDVFKKIYW